MSEDKMKWLEDILNDENIEDKADAIKKELPKNFIPKHEYNAKVDELKQKQQELEETSNKMEELSKQAEKLSESEEEKEQLKEQIDSWKNEFETFKQEAEKRESNIKKQQALERHLRDNSANPDSIDLLMNEFDFENMELDGEGNIKDAEKHIEPIREKRKTLFGETQLSGDKPPTGDSEEVSSYKEQYDQALQNGQRQEAIKIKMQAYKEGEKL